ncbi:MAG: DNA polymerase IV [Candidatus Woesearchaeota archaeon]
MIAHVDMDCFFCACEIKRNPELSGKPVIVGSTGSRGVVSTANYEARKSGVFSATPISIARQKCPEATFLPVDHEFYKQQSLEVMNILDSISDSMQQVSVDEAFLDITSFIREFSDLEEAGKAIQDMIRKKTGLNCSIGISESKTVSKIASDYKKPSGITIVRDMQEFLAPLPIEKIPGIGKVSKARYNSLGIYNIKDLAQKNRFWVIDKLGNSGIHFQDLAWGIDHSIFSKRVTKSHSREKTMQEDLKETDELLSILMRLSERVHSDTRKSFRVISIKIRYNDFTTITRDRSLTAPTRALPVLKDKVKALFLENYNEQPVRLLGVKISDLCKDVQSTLHDF